MKLTNNQKKVLAYIEANCPVGIFEINVPSMDYGWVLNAANKLWRAGIISYDQGRVSLTK